MKKIILLILILSLILSLFSCTESPENVPSSGENNNTEESKIDIDSSGIGYLIVNINNERMQDMYKLFPEEGVIVPLCPDSLCKHDSDSCPFYNVNPTFKISGNTLYYLRTSSPIGNYSTICKYDLEKDKFEVLYTVENGGCIVGFNVYKDQIFFFRQKKGEGSEYLMHLMKLDAATKEVTQLSEKSEADVISLFCVEYGRYYWYDYSTSGYFSTDADFKNRKDDDKGANSRNRTLDKHYDTKVDGVVNSRPVIKVTELGRNGAEDKVILDNSGIVPAFYNGNIIYTTTEEKTLIGNTFVNNKKKEVYDYSGGKYYICNADGTNQRLLCDISGSNCVITTTCTVYGDYTGVGDYIALKVDYYEENDEGYIEKKGLRYAVINIVTGDYKIVGAE
ncbi:MAG: hypothetical protein E7665_07455 [Ruminococcaceae bacterium]|nr:hypothetical protein [Oscillospiraceae bacterium]